MDNNPLPNAIPQFNMLVREAFSAQEAFDQWDEGVTYYPLSVRREVSLEQVNREWDEANAELIRFVLSNAVALLSAINAPKGGTDG